MKAPPDLEPLASSECDVPTRPDDSTGNRQATAVPNRFNRTII